MKIKSITHLLVILAMVLPASLVVPAFVGKTQALGTISCGTVPAPSAGSLTCAQGPGYVRWTFSGVPRQNYNLPFVLSASQPAPAQVEIELDYIKVPDGDPTTGKPSPKATLNENNYIISEYKISNPTLTSAHYRYSYLGPVYIPDGAMDPDHHETLDWEVVIHPATNLGFSLVRRDTNQKEAETITGTITIVLQETAPEASPQPFVCSWATVDGSTPSVPIATWNNNPQFAEMPGSVQCSTGPSYIEWHFTDAHRLDLPITYWLRSELFGEAAELTYDLTMCRKGYGDDGIYQSIKVLYGVGYTDFLQLPRIGFPGAIECNTHASSKAFTFPNNTAGEYQSAELRLEGGYALGLLWQERFPLNGFIRISVPSWAEDSTATPNLTQTPTETPTLTVTPSPTSRGGGGGGSDPPPNPTQPPAPTATFTRTFTPTATNTRTPTATATATATRTGTATVTSTSTRTLTATATGSGGGGGGGGTATPIVITGTPTQTPIIQTATPSFTPAVFSPTPNWQATQTALALTQTAQAWTATASPVVTSTLDWGATLTAESGDWSTTLTAQAG